MTSEPQPQSEPCFLGILSDGRTSKWARSPLLLSLSLASTDFVVIVSWWLSSSIPLFITDRKMSGFFARFRPGRSVVTEKPSHTAEDGSGTRQTVAQDPEAGGEGYEGWVDPYGPRPTVKEWFKWYWHDLAA